MNTAPNIHCFSPLCESYGPLLGRMFLRRVLYILSLWSLQILYQAVTLNLDLKLSAFIAQKTLFANCTITWCKFTKCKALTHTTQLTNNSCWLIGLTKTFNNTPLCCCYCHPFISELTNNIPTVLKDIYIFLQKIALSWHQCFHKRIN